VLSEEENVQIYGKCANANGHGHDYGLEVTVTGSVDPETGQLLPIEALDAIVEDRVLGGFRFGLLNHHPLFSDLVPTAENIAKIVFRELRQRIGEERAGLSLRRVRLRETCRNDVECEGESEKIT